MTKQIPVDTPTTTPKRGGKRAGAGRPKTDRERTVLQLTPQEKDVVKEFIADMRAGRHWVSHTALQDLYDGKRHTAVNKGAFKCRGNNNFKSTSTNEYSQMKVAGLLLNMKPSEIRRDYQERCDIRQAEWERKYEEDCAEAERKKALAFSKVSE